MKKIIIIPDTITLDKEDQQIALKVIEALNMIGKEVEIEVVVMDIQSKGSQQIYHELCSMEIKQTYGTRMEILYIGKNKELIQFHMIDFNELWNTSKQMVEVLTQHRTEVAYARERMTINMVLGGLIELVS